ncbi:putative transcription factor WD40-like family [Helianthus anomalus]
MFLQGLVYNATKNLLYVADTENHALRVIDFVNESVQTLAGNGTKGSDYKGGGKGTSQLLNSPWDVCFEPANQTVYIAMAGQHQIWVHTTLDGVTRAFSGDGYERNLNGSR